MIKAGRDDDTLQAAYLIFTQTVAQQLTYDVRMCPFGTLMSSLRSFREEMHATMETFLENDLDPAVFDHAKLPVFF